MGYFVEKDEDTNGKLIKTGDNVRIISSGKKGFVIAVLGEEYMVSCEGNVDNYYRDEIEWVEI